MPPTASRARDAVPSAVSLARSLADAAPGEGAELTVDLDH